MRHNPFILDFGRMTLSNPHNNEEVLVQLMCRDVKCDTTNVVFPDMELLDLKTESTPTLSHEESLIPVRQTVTDGSIDNSIPSDLLSNDQNDTYNLVRKQTVNVDNGLNLLPVREIAADGCDEQEVRWPEYPPMVMAESVC